MRRARPSRVFGFQGWTDLARVGALVLFGLVVWRIADPRDGAQTRRLTCRTIRLVAVDEYVLDTPVVRTFIDGVRAAVGAAGSVVETVERIRPRFADLLADPEWLPAAYQEPAPESGMGGGIGQWLLYPRHDGSLSLFSLVVPPAAQTPVHDHLRVGLVGLYRGTQDERRSSSARRAACG